MPKNITELIREISGSQMPTIVVGTILGLNPWKIRLVDDQNIVLSDQSLIVPERVTRYTYERKTCTGCARCDICGGGTGCGTFRWRDPLKVGDRVYMLAVNRCKMYYILDRV